MSKIGPTINVRRGLNALWMISKHGKAQLANQTKERIKYLTWVFCKSSQTKNYLWTRNQGIDQSAPEVPLAGA